MTGDPLIDDFLATFFWVIAIGFFIPTYVAFIRGHKRKVGIVILNILVGWTGLGWILLLAYALLSKAKE